LIELVFTIEVKYVQHLAVAIASIVKNCKSSEIAFHIIASGLSDKLKAKFKGIGRHHFHEIYFYDVPQTIFQYALKIDGHATAANYYRLFLTEILPKSIDKVLYLDADLLVLDDLNDLWNVSIEDFAIAAVHHPNPERSSVLKIPVSEYFNSGVMLINLDYWRKHNLVNQFSLFMRDHSHLIQFWDQDVLNSILNRKVLFLQKKWNTNSLDESTSILHFMGKHKPWSIHYHWNNTKKVYFDYLLGTPFRYQYKKSLLRYLLYRISGV
jgi:lipopolysaccharide biosynthesis glycosyltransferase